MADINDCPDQRKPRASVTPVIIGGRCVGHLITRGRDGVEAYDTNDKPIGIFTDERAAVAGLMEAAQ